MRTTKLLLSLSISLMVAYSTLAHEVLSNWKLDRESDDIKISYRNLKVGDTLKTRQMQISFYVDASPERILPMFTNEDNLSVWSARTEKCEIINYDTNTWTTYNLFDIPWPFEQKDLITEYRLVKSNSTINLYMTGKPNSLPYYEGVSRMEKYEGQWTFTHLGNGTTKVELTTVAFTKSNFPKFIQDPILQDVLIESINTMKGLLATQESQRIIAFE